MKLAIVHDWLTGMRGGERVLEVLCERYPDAELFTLLHVRGSVSPVRRAAPHPYVVRCSTCRASGATIASACRSIRHAGRTVRPRADSTSWSAAATAWRSRS